MIAKIKNRLVRLFRPPQNHYAAFGERVLDLADEFVESKGGDRAVWEMLKKDIRKGIKPGLDMAHALSVFCPATSPENLAWQYKMQQYASLRRFFQYPFMGNLLDCFVKPYAVAAGRLGTMDVVDYGCGVPFGLLHLLMENPSSVHSAALVDLDVISTEFSRFAVNRLAPALRLTVHHVEGAGDIPRLPGSYNFAFGKDVFEHLLDPEPKLRGLMDYMDQKRVLCFFDFRDHGEKIHMHVTPDVRFLKEVMKTLGFSEKGEVCELSQFERGVFS